MKNTLKSKQFIVFSHLLVIVFLGFMVLIPDYFRGEYCKGLLWLIWYGKSFCKSHTVLSKINKDYEDFILPYAKNNGAQEIGLIGFCWGSAPVLHLSSLEQVHDILIIGN